MTVTINGGHHKPKWPKCDCPNCMNSTWVVIEGYQNQQWGYAHGPCSASEGKKWAKLYRKTYEHLRFELVIKHRGINLHSR